MLAVHKQGMLTCEGIQLIRHWGQIGAKLLARMPMELVLKHTIPMLHVNFIPQLTFKTPLLPACEQRVVPLVDHGQTHQLLLRHDPRCVLQDAQDLKVMHFHLQRTLVIAEQGSHGVSVHNVMTGHKVDFIRDFSLISPHMID